MKVIKAEKLSKSYKSGDDIINVFQDLSLSIEKNDYISIVGASGIGKSTLLYCLSTVEKPDSGNLYFYTEEEKSINLTTIKDNQLSKIRNNHIGFIFQFHHLLNEFTAKENIMIPALIGDRNMKESEKRADYLMDKIGIAQRKNHYPNQLSGGEQQRVAIARALINEPDIVFADEPTGNLDEKNTMNIIDLLNQLSSDLNLTLCIATHSPFVAENAKKQFEMTSSGLVLKSN